MFRTHVPGHVRAYTLWLALFLAGLTFVKSGSIVTAAGILLVIFGAFVGDQATHLAQMDHSGLPPTWIERQLQKHRWLSVAFGSVLALCGVLIAV